MESYYDILGVSKSAPAPEIKKAYKKLAKQFHPDINKDPSAQDTFKKISKAYQILSDEDKRGAYDRVGHSEFEQAQKGNYSRGGGQGPGGINYEDIFGGGQDPFDIFESIFGSRGYGNQQQTTPRGESIETIMSITFEEAVHGAKKTISYNRFAVCNSCKGSGSNNREKGQEQCRACNGSGQVTATKSIFGAQYTQVTVCPECRGKGHKVINPCVSCSGTGRHKNTETMTIDIPAGVETGMRVKYSGKGNVGEHNSPAGDLNVVFKVSPHKIFTRAGNNILLTVPITISQAVLGDTIDVPTIHGTERFTIPAGTSSRQEFFLKDQGVPDVRTHRRGQQIITIHIEIPRKLTKEQKSLFEQLQVIESDSPSLLEKLFS